MGLIICGQSIAACNEQAIARLDAKEAALRPVEADDAGLIERLGAVRDLMEEPAFITVSTGFARYNAEERDLILRAAIDATARLASLSAAKVEAESLLAAAVDEYDAHNGESHDLAHWSFKAHILLAALKGRDVGGE